MSNFTPLVTRTYEFEGDNVTVIFSRLKKKHILRLFPDFGGVEEGTDNQHRSTILKAIMEVDNSIVDECIKSIKGLTDSEGNTIDDVSFVFDEMYFAKLTTEVFTDLIKESFISGKNS